MSVSVTASLLLCLTIYVHVHRVAAVVLNPHYPVKGGQNFPNQIHLVNWTGKYLLLMDGWMDGWMDGEMDGLMDGGMDGGMDGQTDE